MHTIKSPTPWYREPWPWLLMSGPALVVVAGMATLSLALSSHDGLVVDDYYKQGKEVNVSLRRDDVARAMGVSASVTIDERQDVVRVELQARDSATIVNKPVHLNFVHATSSGLDQAVPLRANAGALTGRVAPLSAGKWHLLLEDDAHTWRLQQTVLIQVGGKAIPTISLTPPPAPNANLAPAGD